MKNYVIFLFISLVSCGGKDIKNEKGNVDFSHQSIHSDSIQYDIKFKDVSIQSEERIKLFLSINERNYEIDEIQGLGVNIIPKERYSTFDIPENAISALESYFAGLRQIFYIKDLESEVSVRAASHAGSDSELYQYKEIFRVLKNESPSSNFKKGIFEFVGCFEIGSEYFGLKFRNNKEEIEIFGATTSIWEMFDWQGESDELKSLKFEIEYDKSNGYLRKCKVASNIESEQKDNLINDFYILNIKAVKTKENAIRQVRELKQKGYEASYLWIPDYNSLSKAEYFSVYIGPFFSQKECELAVSEYRKIDQKVYGLLVSQQNKRVQINGINKVKITEPYH